MVKRTGIWAGMVLLGLGIAGLLFSPGLASAVGGSTGGSYGGSLPYGMMSGIFGNGRSSGYGYGMMGGSGSGSGYGYGGMMGGYVSGTGGTVSTATAARMGNAIPSGASVDRTRNRVVFTGRDVQLNVVGSPMGQKDETFRIAGLVNPVIVVPKGAVVHVSFVNADDNMTHNFLVTPASPPFSYVAMMQAPPAFAGSATPFLGSSSGKSMEQAVTSFVANTPGQYTYLCAVPGHAEKGMYGSFIVQG